MKLKPLSNNRQVWLEEFDQWVTPFLEEIRDSDIFQKTLSNIKEAIDLLASESQDFRNKEASSPSHIVAALFKGINKKNADEIFTLVSSFCDILFLMTGKTDNNCKCQFPIYLNKIAKWKEYPSVNKKSFKLITIPRTISSESIAKLIVQIENYKTLESPTLTGLAQVADLQKKQQDLLLHYFQHILDRDVYLEYLQVFGKSYVSLRQVGQEDTLLAPIITAFVRGSASATGGHKPEIFLRDSMYTWGLRSNEDYNATDVKIDTVSKNEKTRAYDFVLPYSIKGWDNRIFIQAQYYAGDSGSVSHKNVDQTKTSRSAVESKIQNPIFLEYVDGAGYYSSLNGDLKKLFNMPTTYNFFQVRTFPIKLRQVLQEIGFLTPLEFVHALASNNFEYKEAKKFLLNDGYLDSEIERVLKKGFQENLYHQEGDLLKVDIVFYETSRRYYLLDLVAIFGTSSKVKDNSTLFVPGYGPNFGTKISLILASLKSTSVSYLQDWGNTAVFSKDIEFLLEQKWVEYSI